MQDEIKKLVGDDPFKLNLKEPIKVGSTEIKSLKLRNPKGKEVRSLDIGMFAGFKSGQIPPGMLGQLLEMAESLTGTDAETIDELSAEDAFNLGMKTLFLLGQSINIS